MGHFTALTVKCPFIVRDLAIRITYPASFPINSTNFRYLATSSAHFNAFDERNITWLDRRRCYAHRVIIQSVSECGQAATEPVPCRLGGNMALLIFLLPERSGVEVFQDDKGVRVQ